MNEDKYGMIGAFLIIDMETGEVGASFNTKKEAVDFIENELIPTDEGFGFVSHYLVAEVCYEI